MANTPNRGYPLPDVLRRVNEEIEILRLITLAMIDADVHAVMQDVKKLAAVDHRHKIGDVDGLAQALGGFMSKDREFALSDLTDVVGAAEAADGYVLAKVGSKYVAQAALAALGAHRHSVAQIEGLAEVLADLTEEVTDNPWGMQPFGVPIPVFDHIAGLQPPTDKGYRYVKLSAADAYNTGFLTGEIVSGSFPAVQATAVVNAVGSPLHGATVRLINTEGRFLRAGISGTVEADMLASHLHPASFLGNPVPPHTHQFPGHASDSDDNSGTGYGGAPATLNTYAAGGFTPSGAVTVNATGGAETRPKNIGVPFYMRIE